jgi:hypothetical protein
MAIEPGAAPGPQPVPRWDWARLPGLARKEEWTGLIAWVEELQRDQGSGVELQACWPLHEALRAELAFLWYWRRAIDNDPASPAGGVQWHASLQSSADAWRVLATCHHEQDSRPVLMARNSWLRDVDRYVGEALERARAQAPDVSG